MNQQTGHVGIVDVAGDVTIDWNLAHIQRTPGSGKTWSPDAASRACRQRGGMALLADLVGSVTNELRNSGRADFSLRVSSIPDEGIAPSDARFNHSYALWEPHLSGERLSNGKPKLVWRISQFLGLDRCASPMTAKPGTPAKQESTKSDVVVLDDAALGIREQTSLWPPSIMNPQSQVWVVLKIAKPVVQGPLWEHLLQHFAERLIVVMTVEDLRDSEVQISHQLSWERTAQDLFWELTYNPRVNGTSRCAHTVVSFGTTGAFLLSRQHSDNGSSQSITPRVTGRLFFDPEVGEEGWEGDRPGKMIGNTTTLTAGIVRQLLIDRETPDLARGIQSGIAGMRRLFREGFGTYASPSDSVQLAFPLEVVAAELATDRKILAEAPIQDPVHKLRRPLEAPPTRGSEGYWTILEDCQRQSLDVLAEQIVVGGLTRALNGVPIGRFGALQTVDRREIEALNSIQNLIGEYCGQPQTRPLSIAVFGPPGSGKSFGVEQVARSVRPGQIEVRTFNLSQFTGPDDLLGALHQVRDISLKGKLPLVFWDEFDTALDKTPLGWLRLFLSPMQDGSFQEGQVTHPIGSCIFVFAGGTSHQLASFGAAFGDEGFKAVKGPDFISRLKGFLNVLGPNRHITDQSTDPYFIIRRAILLRSIFERNAKWLINDERGARRLAIDPGVLRAFLRISQYHHGARSIESIIAMSALAGRSSFERSCLPSEAQLDLHVNGLEFLSIVQEIELRGELLERLAEAAHDVFCQGKLRDGWKLGTAKNEQEKTHPLLRPYTEISEEHKEANRVTVRNIPKKLQKASYVMVPSRSNESALEFPGDDLEMLAMFEHDLWMEGQLLAGVRPGLPSPEDPLRSEHLVAWDQLPEAIKQIDRDMIRGIPKILAQTGFAVMRVHY